jgi:hypothetical protein
MRRRIRCLLPCRPSQGKHSLLPHACVPSPHYLQAQLQPPSAATPRKRGRTEDFQPAIRAFIRMFLTEHGTEVGGNTENGTKKRIWLPYLTVRRFHARHFVPYWKRQHQAPSAYTEVKAPSLTTFERARAAVEAELKQKIIFQHAGEQKVCETCLLFAELCRPGSTVTQEELAAISRLKADHFKLRTRERECNEARRRHIDEARNRYPAKYVVLVFDGAKAIPAFRVAARASSLICKRPLSFNFFSMNNLNVNRMRFVTSLIDYPKGANWQCTLIWEEILLMLRRGKGADRTARAVPPVGGSPSATSKLICARVGSHPGAGLRRGWKVQGGLLATRGVPRPRLLRCELQSPSPSCFSPPTVVNMYRAVTSRF